MIKPIKGVERHQGGLRIVFFWQGKRYRRAATKGATQKDIKIANLLKKKVEDYKNADQNPLALFDTSYSNHRDLKRLSDEWILYKTGRVVDSTLTRYKWAFEMLIETIGNKLVDNITVRDIEKWRYQKMEVEKLSYSGVRVFKSAFDCFFDWAKNNDFCRKNPSRLVIIKRKHEPDAENNEIFPFCAEDIEKIQAGIMNPRNKFRGHNRQQFYNFFMIAITTGMRPGEMIALTWKDVDFKRTEAYPYGTVNITKSKSRGQALRAPKTAAGIRLHVLTQESRKYFELQRRLTGLMRKHVFVTSQKGPHQYEPYNSSFQITNKMWSDTIYRFCKDVEYRNFYQCRHTYISNLVANGVDLPIIARQVGHVNTRVLLENYYKIFSPQLKDQAQQMSEAQKNRI